jgi:hypothetical protein
VSTPRFESWFANSFMNRIGHKLLFATAMLLCLLWSAASALLAPAAGLHATPGAPLASASIEWPREWDGATAARAWCSAR